MNRHMAIAMRDAPEAGLTHIDAVLEHGGLANYCLAHSARMEIGERLVCSLFFIAFPMGRHFRNLGAFFRCKSP
jgi:hypothetical protein